MENNPYDQLMREAMALHDKKRHDYAQDNDRFSNFTRTAEIVSWFKNPIDQVFACMIGMKLTRLAELRNGKEAKNESTHDSHVDLVNYCALWGAFWDNEQLKPGSIIETNWKRCSQCGIGFTTNEDLIDHYTQMHKDAIG